jgi:hypothetical protein
MADLEIAIEKAEKVIRLTPADHPNLPGWLNNLGSKLKRRYERTEQMADLEITIEKAEKAIRLTSTDHSDLPDKLSILGNKL